MHVCMYVWGCQGGHNKVYIKDSPFSVPPRKSQMQSNKKKIDADSFKHSLAKECHFRRKCLAFT